MEWVRRSRRLNVAAGIAQIDLVCAPSVWSAMLTRCARRYGTVHFPEGLAQPAGAGLVRVTMPDRALCRAVYRAAVASSTIWAPGHDADMAIQPITLTAGERR
ncbi:hypothetical protein AB0G86_34200 [Streptomyces scabiei]|uniref:hypothetical protein n=1 Tax=Streptomyces scabiei TaxID=1930 RepID=UPI00340BF8FA